MAMTRWVVVLVASLGAGCVTTSAGARDVSSLVVLEGDSIMVREAIRFSHGQSEIDPRSTDLLDAVAKILLANSSITLLTIEGHTDSTGDPAGNQPLSEGRALEVKKYLEARGVQSSRLASRGFGSTQPVDTNDTEEGRAKNRRVEFKVNR